MPDGLEIRTGCLCAGTGCGGHLVLGQLKVTSTGFFTRRGFERLPGPDGLIPPRDSGPYPYTAST